MRTPQRPLSSLRGEELGDIQPIPAEVGVEWLDPTATGLHPDENFANLRPPHERQGVRIGFSQFPIGRELREEVGGVCPRLAQFPLLKDRRILFEFVPHGLGLSQPLVRLLPGLILLRPDAGLGLSDLFEGCPDLVWGRESDARPLDTDPQPQRGQSILNPTHQPRWEGGGSCQKDIVHTTSGHPLGRCCLRFPDERGIHLIAVHHEVIEIAIRLPNRVVENELDVHEVLVSGQELSRGCPGGVGRRLGGKPSPDLADGPDRDAVDPVDTPREPDPQSRARVSDDPPKSPDHRPLLRPNLHQTGEQIRREDEKQKITVF